MAEKYFNDLNYSLANEDTRLELDLCKIYKPKAILSICGSGGRFLPLLAAGAKKIVALDLAPQQLYLAEMRKQTILQFDFETFLLYWGFPPYKTTENRQRRKDLFLTLDLSAECRRYFEELYSSCDFEGLILKGKWERTIIGVPKQLRKLIGDRYDEVFDFTSQAEQDAFVNEKLDNPIWKIVPRSVLMLFGNAAFFNAFLYRGHFVKKNIPGTYYDFYRERFKHLLRNGIARENFFLQLCFFGELRYPEGNPIEAFKDVFEACQANLKNKAEIQLAAENVLEYSKKFDDKFDFVSLSDVPSYFAGEAERDYLQGLKRNLNPGAIVVMRAYLRIPEGTILEGYEDITTKHEKAVGAEKVGMYNTFIFRFKG